MLLKGVHRLSDDALLIVEETQLEESVRLSWLVPLLIRYVEQVLQMLDRLVHVSILRVRLSQLLMRLTCFRFVVRFFTQLQELVQEFYSFFQVTQHLVDVTDFLVAFCLLIPIFSSLGSVEALLEELQRLVEVVLVLELNGDDLVHSYKFSGDLFLDFAKISVDCLLESSFQISHCIENIEDFLFTNSETHISLGFSLDKLGLNTDIEALLVVVGCRLVVIELLELLSHYSLLLEAIFGLALPVKALGTDQVVAQLQQRLLRLLELALLSFVQLVLLLESLRWLDLAGSRLRGDVEEVYIGLQEALLHELDALGLGCNFFFQLKVVFLFLKIGAAARHVLFVLVEPVVQRLLAVFLDDSRFSFVQELILFLSLGLFLNLTYL